MDHFSHWCKEIKILPLPLRVVMVERILTFSVDWCLLSAPCSRVCEVLMSVIVGVMGYPVLPSSPTLFPATGSLFFQVFLEADYTWGQPFQLVSIALVFNLWEDPSAPWIQGLILKEHHLSLAFCKVTLLQVSLEGQLWRPVHPASCRKPTCQTWRRMNWSWILFAEAKE